MSVNCNEPLAPPRMMDVENETSTLERPGSSEHHDMTPIEGHNDAVSTLHRCQSAEARKLCLFDIAYKLKNSSDYDIGSTYTLQEPDIWFYYTTSVCPGNNHLLNIFACHRWNAGFFSIGISNSSKLSQKILYKNVSGYSFSAENLHWQSFQTAQADESHHIKTFCISETDVELLKDSILCIPIKLDMEPKHNFNNFIVQQIKLSHDFGSLIIKQENTDFTLESTTFKKYPTHKIILVAHSEVFRNMIKNSNMNTSSLDLNDEDMLLLLEFLYTGTIKDILKQNCLHLLQIADKYKIKNLASLSQFAISEQITVSNAVEIAVLSERFKMDQIQYNVFQFIKHNPDVLGTEGWKNLMDVALAKKLFEHIYKSCK